MEDKYRSKCELCPCGCRQPLRPGQRHHSDKPKEQKDDGCRCEAHGHDHEVVNTKDVVRLIIGAAIYAVVLIFQFIDWLELALFIAAYLIIGGDVLLRAVTNISKGKVFDENFLMSIATAGAFAVREFPEAVAVMLFYQVGELFESFAVNRSRKSITSLMDIRPEYANLKKDGREDKVSPQSVAVGDVIVIKPGERVPLDGVVLSGRSYADTSALTGESAPVSLKEGDSILSGVINQSGVLEVEVQKEYGESTAVKILDLVENASLRKAPTENFISKFAKIYTPIVVVIAVGIALVPPLIFGQVFADWFYRALIFLVISCPCALVISIPLGFFGGIGAASRSGVLIKGSNFLEALREVDTVVFDKTGTLTQGVFKVSDINNYNGFSSDAVMDMAAHIESQSTHPVAKSIVEAYHVSVDPSVVSDYQEIFGHGVKASVKGKDVLAGNAKMMQKFNIDVPANELSGTVVYVAVGGKLAGAISISDQIKPDAKKAIADLKQQGIKDVVMLTGDRAESAKQTAEQLGIERYYAALLPQDKVKHIEDMLAQNEGKVAFVGDGINDAPVLARADVGIAMGGLGSDAAIEAADVVIMNDQLNRIAPAIRIARKTRRIVWQNIIMALVVKAFVLILGAGGLATMWEAVFADVGVALLAVLNALRAIKAGS